MDENKPSEMLKKMPKNEGTAGIGRPNLGGTVLVPPKNQPLIPDEIISPDCDIDRSHKNIPIETIIEYRNRGLSYTEIAKLTGCSRQNVQQRLETVEYSKEDLDHFKKHRGDVFAFLQSKLLNSIDSDAIKGMQPYQRIVGASIMYDKERLEQGKSTGNINILEVSATIEELQKQAEQLRGALREEIKSNDKKT